MITVFVCISMLLALAYLVGINRMMKDMLEMQMVQGKILEKFFSNLTIVDKEEK